MKRFFYLIIYIFASTFLFAQKPPIKFGDISMEDMKMTLYSKDSSAEAVILADYAESNLVYNQGTGFQIMFERIRRLKILTKEGLKWGDFSIPLYHDKADDENISSLKAVCYNLENGKIIETKVKNESIITEKYDDNLNFKKVTWPGVRVGSILEISYRVMSDFLFNFQDWEFQSTIPVKWSEYRAGIPEYFSYSKYMQGYIGLSVNENSSVNRSITLTSIERSGGMVTTNTVNSDKIDYQENRFRWAAKDVPAFKKEPFMTTSRDYISKIIFELSSTKFPNSSFKSYMGSWEDISKTYWNRVKEDVNGNNSLKKHAEEITAGKTTLEEKVMAICDYVKNNVLWERSNRKYPSSTLKNVFEEKKGNSAEVNLLMACLLEKINIPVFPVLISTRDHGFIREGTPASTQFNYVVCLVKMDQKNMLLDGTDRYLPVGMLPENCLNGNGLMVSNDGFQWVSLQPSSKTRTVLNIDLNLTEESVLKGTLRFDRSGYNAASSRKSFLSKGEKEYLKELVTTRSWQISKSEFQNVKEPQQPFRETHELMVNEHITSGGGTYYFNPFIYGREESNPFKQPTREYPVDFGTPFDEMYIIKFTIPQDLIVEELPKSKLFTLPNSAKYSFSCTQMGNTINITSNFSITKSLFSQEEYPNLREFYNQVIAKQAEQIVLKKK